jgi:hypothetical protein
MSGTYSFVCKYRSTDALLVRLQEFGGWDWRIGDSHWYGDYLACVPFPGVLIRIVDFPKSEEAGWRYESDVRLRSPQCTAPMNVIDEAFRKVLAQIPAEDVREIDPFD